MISPTCNPIFKLEDLQTWANHKKNSTCRIDLKFSTCEIGLPVSTIKVNSGVEEREKGNGGFVPWKGFCPVGFITAGQEGGEWRTYGKGDGKGEWKKGCVSLDQDPCPLGKCSSLNLSWLIELDILLAQEGENEGRGGPEFPLRHFPTWERWLEM